MTSEEIKERTQRVWDRFYDWPSVWRRSACTPNLKSRVAFMLLSKLYRQMYAGTGISTDSARRQKAKTMARFIARQTRRIFVSKPMPELAFPIWAPRPSRVPQLTQVSLSGPLAATQPAINS
jgi:hypothetical protein